MGKELEANPQFLSKLRNNLLLVYMYSCSHKLDMCRRNRVCIYGDQKVKYKKVSPKNAGLFLTCLWSELEQFTCY